jgi:hypothetical protein
MQRTWATRSLVAFFSPERRGGERSSLALRLASVCTRQHHKRASLELKVSSLQAWDQILRLGLTLLNHQNKSAPTTATNKIVSFIGLPQIACLIPIYSEHFLETPLVENIPIPRSFPAPWSVDEQPACFIVRDHDGQAALA